jgi:hypothetical protein
MILLVTREDIRRNGEESFQVLNHPETVGHKAASGPHLRVCFTSPRGSEGEVRCTDGWN